MPTLVTCASCRHQFRVGDEFAGKAVTCPGCRAETTATGPTVSAFDVFLSYSSKDKAVADAVVATLEADGVRCWIAPRDIVPGTEWSEAIIGGINQSRAMVLVFSANSNASQQVLREVERAVNRGMPVVPFRVENLLPSKGMEYFISASHWLDAYQPPLDAHLTKLSATTRALLNNSAPPPPPPTDLRSRLKAAAKALTARDNRVRVLAGLVAAVFLIGLVVFAAVYALRPPGVAVAQPELVQAKADAEVEAEKVSKLDKGQGIGAKAEEVENKLKAGQTHFAERRFDAAAEHFKAVAELGKATEQAAQERDSLRTLRSDVGKEFDAAGQSEVVRKAAGWAGVERKKQTAEQAYERGEFAAARAAWNETRDGIAGLATSVESVAQQKALAFWLGYAGRSLREAHHHNAVFGRQDHPVKRWVTVLRDECEPRLGLKPELIETLIDEPNDEKRLTHLGKTLPAALRGSPAHGLEVQRSYWFGHDLATLEWGVQSMNRPGNVGLEVMAKVLKEFPRPVEVAAMFQPAIELAGAAGAPQEWIAELNAVKVDFDKGMAAATGRLNPQSNFAGQAVKRMKQLVEEHASTPDKAAGAFALTLTRPGVPGQDEVTAELRRVRAAVYFDNPKAPTAVTEVYLFVPLSDPTRTLEAVGKLSTLRLLHLGFNPVSDADVSKLAGLTELRVLSLDQTRITDAALDSLKGMGKLEQLDLNKTEITDTGLARLKGLKALREVNAYGGKVTLAGAKALMDAQPRVSVMPFAKEVGEGRIKEFLEKNGIGPDGELLPPKPGEGGKPKRPPG